MRAFWIFLALAALLLLVGASLLLASAAPSGQDVAYYLPPGSYCAYVTFDTVTGGAVTVTFDATPGTVDQFVMTSDQHAAFVAGTTTSYLATASGSSGSYSATLPSGGTYYVETCHGSGYTNALQSGTFSTFVQAVPAGPFYGGVVAVVVGAVLLVLGLWLRGRPDRPAAPAYPAPYPVPAFPGYPYPAVPMPAAGPPPAYGTITVGVENTSAAEESVAILVNGVRATELRVAAGATVSATLHPSLANPYGTVVRIEAVTGGGRRASQDVTMTAHAGIAVSLKVG